VKLGGGSNAAQREARREGLGKANDVGLDVKVFQAKPLAGPAEACLNFVKDHNDAVLVADLTNALHEGLGGHHITTLTQDRFLHDTQGTM
jgi:hypothetical protein